MIDFLLSWPMFIGYYLLALGVIVRFVHNGTSTPTPRPMLPLFDSNKPHLSLLVSEEFGKGVCQRTVTGARGTQRCCYGPPHASREELWAQEFYPFQTPRPFDQERD